MRRILHPPGIDPLGYEQASERWNCDRTVESILVSIQLLLAEPNFNSPANVDAAVLFRSDPERYREEVRRRVEMVMAAPTQPEGQGTMQKQGQKSERRKRKAQKSENSKLAKGEKRNLQHPCWICSDVWLNILPLFDYAQLGLTMALLSYRFDVLVDKHFDGTTEFTILRRIRIDKDEGPKAKLFVEIDDTFVEFPLPDRPLPNKIRFNNIRIDYIDHSVITFFRSNQHIWDRMGTKLILFVPSDTPTDVQPIWDVFVRQIWPAFATNIRQLYFSDANHLDNLRRLTSPTILTDLNRLNSIFSGSLCPAGTIGDAFDQPNTIISASQALAKWLHAPRKDGLQKWLNCYELMASTNAEWVDNFKQVFVHARTSVSYTVNFHLRLSTPIVPFELENEWTNEKMTLEKVSHYSGGGDWLLKRCQINEEKKDENSDANLNSVFLYLTDLQNAIGPLSPPANKSDENVRSSAAGPSSDQRNE
ncbi:hypothetical protein niasHT_034804 [Heterodera trifolii]|uniref:UBC core domain-containing protein n=1 Tax=Heterodera trifolii TaxID=157864 RepID=A0ABD2IEA6_9BILA